MIPLPPRTGFLLFDGDVHAIEVFAAIFDPESKEGAYLGIHPECAAAIERFPADDVMFDEGQALPVRAVRDRIRQEKERQVESAIRFVNNRNGRHGAPR